MALEHARWNYPSRQRSREDLARQGVAHRYQRLCEAARAYEVGPTGPGTAQAFSTTGGPYDNPGFRQSLRPKAKKRPLCPPCHHTESRHNMGNALPWGQLFCRLLLCPAQGGKGRWGRGVHHAVRSMRKRGRERGRSNPVNVREALLPLIRF